MATDSASQHHTRAATLAGVFPPPPPLFSPTSQSMSFGSIEAGELDVDSTAVAVRPSAAVAARPSFAPASGTVTPVARPPSAAGEISSELPSLLDSNVDFAVRGEMPVPRGGVDDGGWTPVTRKSSRSHRSDSVGSKDSNIISDRTATKSGTESTLAQAANNMSKDELLLLANRYAALASQLRGQAEQDQEIKMVVKDDVPRVLAGGQAHPHSDKRSEMPAPTEVRQDIAPPTVSRHCVTVEEIEDEDAPIIRPGPSRDKGKGPDVRNWGDISSLQNFSEEDLRKQRDALASYAEVNRIIKQEEFTPHLEFSEEISRRPSSPPVKPGRRASSPKSRHYLDKFPGYPPVQPAEPPREIKILEPEKVQEIPVVPDRDPTNDRELKKLMSFKKDNPRNPPRKENFRSL
ncbi:hypothetical protein R3P38DRAFT_3437855 [Favolaschia claudopus]|uniref:Uncharacterized protein n=1 Tax=Favolaschia claudopus TaxID=2862362 RepID=A0AAV9ZSR1_9AGAR